MEYLATKLNKYKLTTLSFIKGVNISKLNLIALVLVLYILQFNSSNTNTNLVNDIPEDLLPYLNKNNYNNGSLGSIELMRNIKSDFNTHFPMYNSSVVTTLTV
jgi:uncharacterized protein (DUF3820 family)